MKNWPHKNKFEESKQNKNTSSSRIASLEHIANFHTGLFHMEGGNFYLVHKLILKSIAAMIK